MNSNLKLSTAATDFALLSSSASCTYVTVCFLMLLIKLYNKMLLLFIKHHLPVLLGSFIAQRTLVVSSPNLVAAVLRVLPKFEI